jgi:hypothetical protein
MTTTRLICVALLMGTFVQCKERDVASGTTSESLPVVTPTVPMPEMLRSLGAPWPQSASAEQIISFIDRNSGSHQSMSAFMYGEYCAQAVSLDRVLEIGGDIPPAVMGDFYDGAAHGLRDPDPEASRQKVETQVPHQYRRLFHDGVVRAYTEKVQGDPAQVIPFSEDYVTGLGDYDPINGIRVGLQRGAGDDMPHALDLAGQYPEKYQPALFEELGWRVGNDQQLFTLKALRPQIPEASACAFAQGVSRGFVLFIGMSRELDWPLLASTLRDKVSPICPRGTWRGVGWAVELRSAHDPVAFAEQLSWMTDPQERAWAEEAMQSRGQPSWDM